ncbi:hypothetical protein MLD38_035255 [Melastoma candidum]|uniref:Uncharacterized protein n=1 Tax=Melastoma candidum TaxID=119954 RepID=A0ACB9ME94_9MYRT|nr:hypothetical protein MLD38_035255 [Melastoma candidum]
MFVTAARLSMAVVTAAVAADGRGRRFCCGGFSWWVVAVESWVAGGTGWSVAGFERKLGEAGADRFVTGDFRDIGR